MRFYTADTHFGHANIIRYSDRPFADVDAMNAAIVATINERCGPDDELWVLGDLALGSLDDSLALIERLAPAVHLIIGNHDRPFHRKAQPTEAQRAKADRTRQRYLDAGIVSLAEHATHQIDGREVELSHFPYAGDHTEEDRYAHARPTDHGRWLLCGHVHDSWRQRGRQINVGVDVRSFTPLSETDVAEIIAAGPRDLD